MKKTRNILILLLLLLVIPFNIDAVEVEVSEDTLILDSTVDTTITNEDTKNDEIVTLDKVTDHELEEVSFSGMPKTNGQWAYIIIVFTILIVLFGCLSYTFYKVFAAYSSVFEQSDDNENIITIK